MTVSEITTQIKRNLETSFSHVSITGEISNFSPASSGHWYFTLKDSNAAISCVMFRGANSKTLCNPTDGMAVTVEGNVSVYAPRGSYQIICTTMQKQGEGDLLAMLEERKQRLAKEGLFDQAHKQALPKLPKKIGVITSPTGAAIRDILQVLQRRNSGLDVVVLPTLVQGDGAGASVAARIRQANRLNIADVLIVGRGGGSLEDLLPFSDEQVVRAIYHSKIPVVSAVGHEVDTMLSDYVADLRAPTPSAAAELVAANREDLERTIQQCGETITRAIFQKIERLRLHLGQYKERYFAESLQNVVRIKQIRLDEAEFLMKNEIQHILRTLKERINIRKETLAATSPLEVLRRGYAMVTDKDGSIIMSPDRVAQNEQIHIQFEEGKITARVEDTNEKV